MLGLSTGVYGTPNMNNPVLIPTPPAKLKLSPSVIVTPTKKKLKTSSYAVRAKRIKFGAEFEKQVLFTETIGMGDTMMLFVEKETSRQGGYMTPLIKAGIKMSFKPFGESMFDVACSTYLFLRESHENNKKHDMAFLHGLATMSKRSRVCWTSLLRKIFET